MDSMCGGRVNNSLVVGGAMNMDRAAELLNQALALEAENMLVTTP